MKRNYIGGTHLTMNITSQLTQKHIEAIESIRSESGIFFLITIMLEEAGLFTAAQDIRTNLSGKLHQGIDKEEFLSSPISAYVLQDKTIADLLLEATKTLNEICDTNTSELYLILGAVYRNLRSDDKTDRKHPALIPLLRRTATLATEQLDYALAEQSLSDCIVAAWYQFPEAIRHTGNVYRSEHRILFEQAEDFRNMLFDLLYLSTAEGVSNKLSRIKDRIKFAASHIRQTGTAWSTHEGVHHAKLIIPALIA